MDDYVRGMHEIEQAFAVKRAWRAMLYTLDVQIIDTQATLLKSQNYTGRDFDKNFALSQAFLRVGRRVPRSRA